MMINQIRVDMDEDGTAEITEWNGPPTAVTTPGGHTVTLPGSAPVAFHRTMTVDETAGRVRELIAAGYVPGAPDDDPRVPGRTGTTYVIGGGADA